MTPATEPDAELTPDLIDRVTKLSPAARDKLVQLIDDLDAPPDDRTDAEIAAEIKRRSDEHHAGTVPALTREESEALIRAEMRKLGFELP